MEISFVLLRSWRQLEVQNSFLQFSALFIIKQTQARPNIKKKIGVTVMTSQVCWSQNVFRVPRHVICDSSEWENCRTPKANSGTSNMKLIFSRNISVVTGN